MSALTRLLQAVLQMHAVRYVDTNDVAHCRCGMKCHDDDSAHDPGDLPRHSEHLASVITELPNVAVIAMPDAYKIDDAGTNSWKTAQISAHPSTGLVWFDARPAVHDHRTATIIAAEILAAARTADGRR